MDFKKQYMPLAKISCVDHASFIRCSRVSIKHIKINLFENKSIYYNVNKMKMVLIAVLL